MLYTVYASTTNYGTGFVLSKDQAIDQIQSQSVGQVEEATAFDATPMRGSDGAFAGYALYDPDTEELSLGTTEGIEPLEGTAELQVLTTTGRTFVVSVGDLEGVRPGDLDTLPGFPADPETYLMPTEDGGNVIISGGQAFEAAAQFQYDPERDVVVDNETGHRLHARRGPVHGARRNGPVAGVPDQRRVRQLPRDLHRERVPRRVLARLGVEHRLRRAVRDHDVRLRAAAGDGVQRASG